MSKLTLFWGEKDDLSFTWLLNGNQNNDQSNSSLNQLETYQLESHEILKADLSCIADMAESKMVTLVLSSTDVVAAQVEVPNKNIRLLRKAVPYMLEDEVAISVNELFFAFADKIPDNQLSVRAIDRTYLESIIDHFKSAEIKLFEILTDIDLILPPEEGLKLIVSDTTCLSVDQDNKRWHCHPDDFSWLIQKQISSDDTEDELPVAIPLDIYSKQEMDVFIHQLPIGRFAVQSHQLDDISEFLLQENAPGINLLQAEYEVKKESSQLSGFLSKVAMIAGFVLLTHLVYQGVNIYSLSEKKGQLDAQKYTLYKQAFPGKRKVSNPYKAMKGDAKLLGSSGDGGGFLSLLSSASNELTDINKVRPTNISYENIRGELRMDVIASDLVVLDQYADALRKNGHTVEKSSETQRGDGYSSRLTIRN